jgi:hypothetical protein
MPSPNRWYNASASVLPFSMTVSRTDNEEFGTAMVNIA